MSSGFHNNFNMSFTSSPNHSFHIDDINVFISNGRTLHLPSFVDEGKDVFFLQIENRVPCFVKTFLGMRKDMFNPSSLNFVQFVLYPGRRRPCFRCLIISELDSFWEVVECLDPKCGGL